MLFESSIDQIRKTLSRQLFVNVEEEYPILKEEVVEYILNRVGGIEETYGYEIDEVMMIGSILTRQYRNDADVDVNLFFKVPKEEREEFILEVREDMSELNGWVIPNTEHVLNFYAIVDEELQDNNLKNAESIFSITRNEWIVKNNLDGFNHNSVYDSFSALLNEYLTNLDLLKGEIKRDIIDYQILDTLTKNDVSNLNDIMEQKLNEIEENILEYLETITAVTQERRDLFLTEMTPEEIIKFKKHNNLPLNIVYKLLEKYHYLEFAKKIKEILKDNVVTKKEMSSLSEIIKLVTRKMLLE